MYKDPMIYLKHILDECEYILSAMPADATEDSFWEDETLKRAMVRSLEIIGEAAKNITEDLKDKWNSIHWKNMAGMRDRLIHDYMGINYSIVWDVIHNKIPELAEQIAEVICNENTNTQ
jgi:uncharacterized protein with HEPN domain